MTQISNDDDDNDYFHEPMGLNRCYTDDKKHEEQLEECGFLQIGPEISAFRPA